MKINRVNVHGVCVGLDAQKPVFVITTEGKYQDMELVVQIDKYLPEYMEPKWRAGGYLQDYPATIERIDLIIKPGELVGAFITITEIEYFS